MNWKQLLTDLKTAGVNQAQIAQEAGCSQPTISDLFSGKLEMPRWAIGVALIDLHKKHMRKSKAGAK